MKAELIGITLVFLLLIFDPFGMSFDPFGKIEISNLLLLVRIKKTTKQYL
jgi:hypothetical protein